LSLKLSQHQVKMRCVGFNFGEAAEELAGTCAPLDVAYRPVINEYQGMSRVEVQLVDWRVSSLAGG